MKGQQVKIQFKSWFAAALVPAVVASFPAFAADGQDADMEEITVVGAVSRYSATKSDTPILEIARSVSIETQQDLIDKGALDLADAYLYSPGVFGERYGFATRGDWLSVRGLGVPEYRDSLQALFGNYNNARPDIYTIEQVEILKGPASVLYGQGSPGGIVNIVSKTPKATAANEVVAEVGSFNRAQLGFDSTGPLTDDGKWLYRVVALHRDTETQTNYVDEKRTVFAPSITWRPTDATNITALVNVNRTDSDTGAQFFPIEGTLNPAPNGEFIDFDTYAGEPAFNRYNTDSTSVTLLADHQLNDIWSIETTARVTEGESDYNQAWPAFIGGDRYARNPDGSLYENGTVPRSFYLADNTSDQKAIDTRARAYFSTGTISHELMIGLQYQDVETDSDTAYMYALGYDFATGGPDANLGDRFWLNLFDPVFDSDVPDQSLIDQFYSDTPGSTTRDLGLYVNDQIDVGRLSISLGLRHDEVETETASTTQDDQATSYSIGALYAFDSGISPYASYAESFEPVVGTDGITGEPLKPREGEQVEVGLKYQPPGTRAYVTLAWFDIEESNLSNPNAIVGANSQQEGVSEVDGAELEALIPVGDFTLELNASRVNTKDPDGFQFASVPENQASAWLEWTPSLLSGFKSGLGVRYVGDSQNGADSLVTPSYTLVDMMVGYRLDNWTFRLNAHNITDKEYMATCLSRGDCFLGEKRSVVGTVSYNF
ncbi:MAG: TonB-dependent siderophore receptor [Gammaproteobacteria bacterium]|nr:TonB-dependent siderophore receptor [Gammaproteobacteria bacterium]